MRWNFHPILPVFLDFDSRMGDWRDRFLPLPTALIDSFGRASVSRVQIAANLQIPAFRIRAMAGPSWLYGL